MKSLLVGIWLLTILFLTPGALYRETEQIPKLIMEAASNVLEPGQEWDWESERMAEDPNLEITWGASSRGIARAVSEDPGANTSTIPEDSVGGDSPAAAFESEQADVSENSENKETAENAGNEKNEVSEDSRPVSGQVYSLSEMENFGFLRDHFLIEDETVEATPEVFDAKDLLGRDLTLYSLEAPQILIYHTHSQEEYQDSVPGDKDMMVQGLGSCLAEILEGKGFSVLHIRDEFDMVEGELERSRAYTYAKERLEELLEEYPSIQVIIDLHRDAVPEELHLVTDIDGKPTAKIMFFNGMSENRDGPLDRLPNPYRQDNLAFSLQMMREAEAYYPGLMRGIYLKCYRYNLHLRARSVLVEVGAQNNTWEEAVNAMEPFADILSRVLNGDRIRD